MQWVSVRANRPTGVVSHSRRHLQNVVYFICSLEENEFTFQFTQLRHAFYYTMKIFWSVILGLGENSGRLKIEICQGLIYLHSIQDFKTPLLC
jgi:hypothetical protein